MLVLSTPLITIIRLIAILIIPEIVLVILVRLPWYMHIVGIILAITISILIILLGRTMIINTILTIIRILTI